MKELLEYIVKSLIEDGYEIEEKEEDGKTIFEIKVVPDKIGLLIGKHGRIIKAVQDIVKIRARLENKIVFIKVVEK
jgi:predicted RNA-binding protein YlqC (UPF0109 family)